MIKKIRNYEEIANRGDERARQKVLQLMDLTLQEVDAYKRILEIMHLEGELLSVGTRTWDLSTKGNIYLLGAGKACNAMAKAVCEVLGERITKGIISVKIVEEEDCYCNTEVYVGGHPLPNEEGIKAAKRMLEVIEAASERDLFISVCSGGSSALLTYPVAPITLEDEIAAQDLLLKSGAKILEINAVRRHISRTNGGRLAEKICHEKGAELISFQISDAVGKPTVADRSQPAYFRGTPFGGDQTSIKEAREMIVNYALKDKLPESVVQYIFDDSQVKETPFDIDENKITTFVIGNLADSCKAAKEIAEKMGDNCMVLTTYLEGESSQAGMFLSSLIREIKYQDSPVPKPCFVICAGETTCNIEQEPRGVGGPSQELVLGMAIGLKGIQGVAGASIDTEGTDGPTIHAGGIVDGSTVERLEASGENVFEALRYHSTGNALEKIGDYIYTGNTGTNLCDLNICYIDNY